MVVDRTGLFRYRRSRWWQDDPVAGPHPRWNVTRATWTNLASGAPYAYCPTAPGGFATGRDLDDVVNRVSLARAGGRASRVLRGLRDPATGSGRISDST